MPCLQTVIHTGKTGEEYTDSGEDLTSICTEEQNGTRLGTVLKESACKVLSIPCAFLDAGLAHKGCNFSFAMHGICAHDDKCCNAPAKRGGLVALLQTVLPEPDSSKKLSLTSDLT